MLEEVQDVASYLRAFGPALAARIQEEAKPLFVPGSAWDPKLHSLLRTPFPAQGDVVMAVAEALQRQRSAIVVGEMGSGKSLIGSCVPYVFHDRPFRVLVMCPGHLVGKWRREVLETVPGAQARILRSLGDLLGLDPHARPAAPEYFILSKERAKLGYAWRPAAWTRRAREGFYCSDCGSLLLDKDGVPLTEDALRRNRSVCPECKAPLWSADNRRMRRFALADYIKKRMKGYFDFFIADEVHMLKGGATAQGNCLGALASACGKTIALTGTLLGGYADDLFYVCFRLSPQSMREEDLGYGSLTQWMSRYGVLERVTRTRPEDNLRSRGKRSSTLVRRKPGVSPAVFPRHLLEKCAFLHLSDISLDLPPIAEEVVEVGMEGDLEAAYRDLEERLVAAVREALARGSRALLGTYLNALLSYPDRPFGNELLRDPKTEQIIAIPPELSPEEIYPKEEALLRLIEEELSEHRRVFVYCQYTATKDVTERLKGLLEERGVRAAILRASVEPERREEWLHSKVEEGIQVIIANPRLVETGLDLLDFPTLVFHQTGYSVFTLRQASRRSWRIGQGQPVKIFYLCYRGTMQERALQLMGSKMEASLAIEGRFSDEGLLSLIQGEDMATLLAKTLAEGLQVEAAEHVWRKLNEANRKQAPQPALPKAEAPSAPARVVHVDL
ncbi:MAG: ATP-dependent helicase, partial [Candidatus Tectomicrobia bacterium]|nr:ATP-dependent helicase [Candidatus Tectomicrobia bacterium]